MESLEILCKKKSSEDRMLNRISDTYGRDCTILRESGNQLKGCLSTLNEGMRRLISKRFRVIDVDEYKTSKGTRDLKKKNEMADFDSAAIVSAAPVVDVK